MRKTSRASHNFADGKKNNYAANPAVGQIVYAPHVPISNTEILSNKFSASLDLKSSHHL